MVKKEIKLDAWNPPQNEKIIIVQGETDSRKLIVYLHENGGAADLTGCTARLYLEKPNGDKIFQDAKILSETAAKGVVEIVLHAQAAAVCGYIIGAVLRVTYPSGAVLKYPLPELCVLPADEEEAMESLTVYSALDTALVKAGEAAKLAGQMKEFLITAQGTVPAAAEAIEQLKSIQFYVQPESGYLFMKMGEKVINA